MEVPGGTPVTNGGRGGTFVRTAPAAFVIVTVPLVEVAGVSAPLVVLAGTAVAVVVPAALPIGIVAGSR
jgi:hypothetical protein